MSELTGNHTEGPPDPMTTAQACKLLQCSRAWFNKHTGTREPVMKLPGRTGANLWSLEDVQGIADDMGREITYSTVGGG